MIGAVSFACLWLIAANVIAFFPSKKKHWPAAYVLIATGIPLLAWVVVEAGPLIAAVFLLAGCSILRWPVIYLVRWLKAVTLNTARG